MLDNISIHLLSDEAKQLDVESQAANGLQTQFTKNRRAFRQHVPNIFERIDTFHWQEWGIFCNKHGEFNLVNKTNGRTLYGPDVEREIACQYNNRLVNAPTQIIADRSSTLALGLATEIDVLFVLGIGIGHHLDLLIKDHEINHCIIYEPNEQYFYASMLCFDWYGFLDKCKKSGTAVYFQIGEDGSNFISDMQELSQHITLSKVSVYKHYNTTTFNGIEREFRLNTWQKIETDGISWTAYLNTSMSLPLWTPPSNLESQRGITTLKQQAFDTNIKAFEKYFPEIAKEFKSYEPRRWSPVENDNGTINLIHIHFPETIYGPDAFREGKTNYENFYNYPHKDGLVLGYDGTKLKKYTHYQFVSQTEALLDGLDEEKSSLPDNLKALIMFGLEAGYSLENLIANHSIQNTYICEPEPDFFYASLFAIDWAGFLKAADESEKRVYINIGDNGENLFRDLLKQFYAVGPYILANTYFFQTYYRDDLVNAIKQLREQLQVVVAMGECYDHARYGISHTVETIQQGVRFLKHSGNRSLSFNATEVPVFIVGNGPSLDSAIDTIKEYQDSAIIVSCGTALQSLYKNNIQPDFHAEIEQNRSTYDWISRVGAPEFIKNTTLLSCNGIHPDTCGLFHQVLLAFKEGESSTTCNLNLLTSDDWATLEFAFPTVTNFVVNLFLELGFEQLYLFGVDLGFVDEKTHHSKYSGYYKQNGQEIYDYSSKNHVNLTVEGNFKPVVYTKYEFKIAKEIMEQSLAGRRVDCFNCSDGAKIYGTIPLAYDSVLISSDVARKQASLAEIVGKAYSQIDDYQNFQRSFDETYSLTRLSADLDALIHNVEETCRGNQSVEHMQNQQKVTLFDSYQKGNSLLFYLLYGTSNYANAVFSQLNQLDSEDSTLQELGQEPENNALFEAIDLWRTTLTTIRHNYIKYPKAFDFAFSMHLPRERTIMSQKEINQTTHFICEPIFKEDFQRCFEPYAGKNHLSVFVTESAPIGEIERLLLLADEENGDDIYRKAATVLDQDKVIFVTVADQNDSKYQRLKMDYPQHRYCFILIVEPIRTASDLHAFNAGERPYVFDELAVTWLTRLVLIDRAVDICVPKLRFADTGDYQHEALVERLSQEFSGVTCILDFPDFIMGFIDEASSFPCDFFGNRGRPIVLDELSYALFEKPVTSAAQDSINAQFNQGDLGGKNSRARAAKD